MGDAPSKYSPARRGTFLALVTLAELRRLQGEAAEAVALLRKCLTEYPRYLGAVLPLAQAMLAAEPIRRSSSRVEELVADYAERPLHGRRRALRGGSPRHRRAAVPQGRRAQPGNGAVHVAIAESLLSQSRWAEAAAMPPAVAESSSGLGRELADVRGDHGGRRGLRRWAERAEGGSHPAQMPGSRPGTPSTPAARPALAAADSAPLLGTILEALLRARSSTPSRSSLCPRGAPARCPPASGASCSRTCTCAAASSSRPATSGSPPARSTGPDAHALIGLAQVASPASLHEEACSPPRRRRSSRATRERGAPRWRLFPRRVGHTLKWANPKGLKCFPGRRNPEQNHPTVTMEVCRRRKNQMSF